MSLPSVKYPTYDLIVPSTKQKIKYRPFLVREYKLILQAIELGDPSNFINTIYNVVKSCTFEKIDVEKLLMYDIDYIFLMLRAKSIGEIIPVEYRCNAEIEKTNEEGKVTKEPCNTKVSIKIDLNEIEVVEPEGYEKNRVIMIDETVGIKLRPPTFAQFKELSKIESVDSIFNVAEMYIYSCVECIFDGDKIMVPNTDFDQNDFSKFIENLPGEAVEKINEFFSNLPYVSLKLKVKCPKCGNEDEIEIRNLEDFFV